MPSTLRRIVESERRYWWGWAVIIGAIALRVAWAAWIAHSHPEAVVSGDSPGYLGPAESLIDSGDFNLAPGDSTPMFLRTPGYPVFLGAILWVTDSQWSISPIQAALSILAVLVVVYVGRRTVGPAAGMLAGVIVALDPLQFALSGTILTESLWTLLVALIAATGIAVFARAPAEVRVTALLALGAVIAIATIVRPTTYYYPLLVALLILIRFRTLGFAKVLTFVGALALPILLLVGGWQLRNHDAVDSWEVSGSPAVTLYCWHAAEVEAQVQGISIREARLQLECHPGGWDDLNDVCPSWWACDVEDPLADGPSWDEMRSRGVEILVDNPVEAAQVYLEGLAREIGAPGTDTVARFLNVSSSRPLDAVLALWALAVWGAALVGVWVGLRSRERWYWSFIVVTIAYVLLISAGANSAARFRAPLIPMLALLAVLGAKRLARHLVARGDGDATKPGESAVSAQASGAHGDSRT